MKIIVVFLSIFHFSCMLEFSELQYQVHKKSGQDLITDDEDNKEKNVPHDIIQKDVIIDNRDSETSQTGTWGVSSAPNPYGDDSVWSRDGTTFSWHFTPNQNINYEIMMWWTEWASRSNNIPVDIQHASGTTRVFIDQSKNGGKWNTLGKYSFKSGQNYKVTITSQPDPSSTCADAVLFIAIDEIPEIIEPSGIFDRSIYKSFPPIARQRGWECQTFSTVYYGWTDVNVKLHDWNSETGDNKYLMSQRFVYNIRAGGKLIAGDPRASIEIMQLHGVCTRNLFYPDNSNWVTIWPSKANQWREAINFRADTYSTIDNLDNESNLNELKKYIVNDKYATMIGVASRSGGYWVIKQTENNPYSSLDNDNIGEYIGVYGTGTGGGHVVAVVGYNDYIWTDINENGIVDPGELGAIKIAESHGPNVGNKGFYWISYDALKTVSDLRPSNTRTIMLTNCQIFMAKRKEVKYKPKLLAEFRLRSAAREHIRVSIHRTSTNVTPPLTHNSWTKDATFRGWVLSSKTTNRTQELGFDGEIYSTSALAPTATFVFDLTDIVTADYKNKPYRYVLEVMDMKEGKEVIVESFKIIYPAPEGDIVTYPKASLPQSVDGSGEWNAKVINIWADFP